jgi:hypothetical protein
VLVAIPLTLGGLLVGIVVGAIFGVNVGGPAALLAGCVGLIAGATLGVIYARRNGLAMNDWVCNDPLLSAGDKEAAVEVMLPPENQSGELANPPFEFTPAKSSNAGCALAGVLGLIPGAVFMFTDGPVDAPLTLRPFFGALVGFLFFGFFGWLFGFVVGVVRGITSMKEEPPIDKSPR